MAVENKKLANTNSEPVFGILDNTKRSSAHMLKNFISNFGLSWLEEKFSRMSPREISERVKNRMVKEIDLFEKEDHEGEARFKRDENGRLIPRPGVQETHGITLTQVEAVYDMAETPTTLEELHQMIDPLEKKTTELIRLNRL